MRYSIFRMPLKLRLCLWAIVAVLFYQYLGDAQQRRTRSEGVRYWQSENSADHIKAFQIFSRLANQGDVRSQFYLGALYHSGLGVAQDDVQATYWYRQAAEKKDKEAQFYLAHMLLLSKLVPHDPNEALKWLEASARQGDMDAALRAGILYDSGDNLGLPRDVGVAHRYYQQAIEGGHEQAPFFMALSLGVCQKDDKRHSNNAEIVRFLEIGHQRGHMNSSYFLGRGYLEGRFSLYPDKTRAIKYLTASAGRNHYDSIVLLTRLGMTGATFDQSRQKMPELCAMPYANLLFYEKRRGVLAGPLPDTWADKTVRNRQMNMNAI